VVTASISSIGTAFPPVLDQQDAWDGFFAAQYGDSRLARRMWRNSGVERRHVVVDPRVEDLRSMSTGARMRRFVHEALPLGKEAVQSCLVDAGLDAKDVDLLTVVSCTGYATPGIDILLARDVDMRADLQRVHVGHMGCYAALAALGSVTDAAVARGKRGVLLCIELTSLHIQPPSDDLEQLVTHALFSDAAAAIAVTPGGPGLEVLDIVSCTDATTTDHMSWEITDLGFRMGLAPQVASVLERHVGRVVTELLDRHGVRVDDVEHWAIHPGGPKVVDAVGRQLGLDDAALAASRAVLRRHGNCSSATVLLVLDELFRTSEPKRGDHAVALAFGPGLTLYAALLRHR
jgi:predicted naringenin-chalcone synthase